MKRLLFLLLLLSASLPSIGSAQTVLPWEQWRGVWVDGNALNAHDTVSADVPQDEFLLWATPRTLRAGDVDSIGVWCELPRGAKLKVGTAWNSTNYFFNDTLTSIVGPKPYGLYSVPFLVGNIPDVNYVVVYVDKGSASIDACCLKWRGEMSVPVFPDNSEAAVKARWYNELGVEDSIHGVIHINCKR